MKMIGQGLRSSSCGGFQPVKACFLPLEMQCLVSQYSSLKVLKKESSSSAAALSLLTPSFAEDRVKCLTTVANITV